LCKIEHFMYKFNRFMSGLNLFLRLYQNLHKVRYLHSKIKVYVMHMPYMYMFMNACYCMYKCVHQCIFTEICMTCQTLSGDA